MMRHLNIALIITPLFLLGCGTDSSQPVQPEGQQGTLRVRMTDAPAKYEAVLITFTEISAHINGQWHTVVGQKVTVDLLQWNNGKSTVLGEANLPVGAYTQLRLIIEKAEVRVDGKMYSMDVPSGATSGLKIHHTFNIDVDATYDLVLDFDASRSIVVKGPESNPNGYALKPVIRAVEFSGTGSVSGRVVNYGSPTVAYAINESDTVTTSIAQSVTGQFTLAFLPAGTYKIKVVNLLGNVYIHSQVTIVAGADYNLGLITLL